MYFLSLTVRLVEYSFSMTTSLNHWPISTPHRVLGASWLTPWGWGKPYKWLASLKSSSVVPQLVMSCAWYLSTHSKTGSASLTAGFPHPLLEWIKPCSLLSRRQMHPPVQFSIALLMYQHSLKLTEHQNQGWRLANDCMTTACTVHTVTHTHTHTHVQVIREWRRLGGLLILGYELFRILCLSVPSLTGNKLPTKKKKSHTPATETLNPDKTKREMEALIGMRDKSLIAWLW